MFKPVENYFITPILVNLNIVIFIAMVLGGANIMLPDSETLLGWGANFRPSVLSGEWWRLITGCFIHIGILHLLMNMYALVYIGVLLEPHLGRTRFLIAYLLTGITASVTSLWWHELAVSAGASGAIFGMYGVFLALLTTSFIEQAARKPLLTSIGLFVLYNLGFGMASGIDNAAHIGGLVGGLFIGYLFVPGLKKPEARSLQIAALIVSTVVVIVFSVFIASTVPNGIGEYQANMKEFTKHEQVAMELFRLPQDTEKAKLLACVKDGLQEWQACLALVNEAGKLDVPYEVKKSIKLLREYCELRIKSFNLIYKAVSENTEAYKSEIENYNSQIEKIINDLKAANTN
jgi:rhomboid protease GluP